MSKNTRLFKSILRLLLPAVVLIVGAIIGGSVWLVYSMARPVHTTYLVTPSKYGQLSTRASQVTEEIWPNRDGSTARGWLLRGAENAPAVLLLHKYGADRSYVLNLGVKLNESTNFTVLMPDQRGHGEDPHIKNASFGGCESEDASAAIEFLRGLQTPNQIPLVHRDIGIFGIEMGGIAAINAAAKDSSIRAIAVDSVPADSDGVLSNSVTARYPFASFATSRLAKLGTYFYYFDGCYGRDDVCNTAKQIDGRSVLVLAGFDSQNFQESTTKLAKCFPAGNRVESKLDLSPSGISIINASIAQSEVYDQRVIDFFRSGLAY